MSRDMPAIADRSAPTLAAILDGERVLFRAAEFAACCGALLSGVRPTAVGWWNLLLAATFGWAVVWVGARGRRWSWAFAAVFTTLFAGASLWAVIGCAAILLAGWAVRLPRPDRVVGAAILAIVVQVALRLPAFGWFGTQSLLAAAALAPVLITGFQGSGRRGQKRIRAALTGLGILATLAMMCAGVVLYSGVRAVSGLDAVSAEASTALRKGDLGEVRRILDDVQARVSEADNAFNGPLAQPARLIPVVSQHVSVAGSFASSGRSVLGDASRLADSLSATPLRSGGRVDLAQLQAVNAQLGLANIGLEEVVRSIDSVERAWLVPQLVAQLRTGQFELAEVLEISQTTHTLAGAGATIFGVDGPTRWFVIFGTTAEARELGGLMTAWAVIEAEDGVVRIVASGNENEVNDFVEAQGSQLSLPGRYESWYPRYDLVKYPQNITGSPDLAIVATAVSELFEGIGGAPLDGVIYAGPEALQALISLVGPVQLASLDAKLTEETTTTFLLRDQYALFPDRDVRKQVLIELLTSTFGQLSSVEQVDLGTAGESLLRVASERRLQVYSFDPTVTEALAAANLYQPWPNNSGEDFLAVLHTNGAPSKLDAWLEKDIVYRVQFDPSSGERTASVEVTLTSTVDETTPDFALGRPFDGRRLTDNRVLLSIMTNGEPGAALVNGELASPRMKFIELGYTRDMISVDVPAGESVTVVWPVTGKIRQGDYRLLTASQPAATDVDFELILDVADPWNLIGLGPGQTDVISFELDRNRATTRRVAQGEG